jgi:hypothetical protein
LKQAKIDEQRARIDALCDKWLVPLGLGPWNIDFYFNSDRGDFKTDNDGEILMRVSHDWRYLQASVAVNVRFMREIDDEYFEQCFLHELMHLHLSELQACSEDFCDHEEHVATKLAKAFLWCVKYVPQVKESDG